MFALSARLIATVSLLVLAAAPSFAAPATFAHPGALVSRSQLDFVRGQVNAGQEPWASAYKQMISSKYGDLNRQAKPRATVECGSYSDPNNGCTDEREDAIAAYTMALAWYITQDSRYANKAISYFDAWSGTIKTHTNSNAPLQTGWAGASWPRAAEIIRYTYSGWSSSSITKFSDMLRNVYLPQTVNGSNSNGNWELVMLEAALGISIFLEDRASYDKVYNKFLGRVPAYVYLTTDGAYPKAAPGSGLDTKDKVVSYWQQQSTFPENGIAQETCRDFVHTGYGIASIAAVLETLRIQGNDLYGTDLGERLRYALGFHSRYEVGAEAVPSWLCGGSLNKGLGPITEIGFNALNTRRGVAMTNTQTLTERQRPAAGNNLFVAWQTLTHAKNPY